MFDVFAVRVRFQAERFNGSGGVEATLVVRQHCYVKRSTPLTQSCKHTILQDMCSACVVYALALSHF
jgi:hypothetical protein